MKEIQISNNLPKENDVNLSQPSTSKTLVSCDSDSSSTISEKDIVQKPSRNRKCSLEKSSSSLEDSLVVKEAELIKREGVYDFVKTLIKNLDENGILSDSVGKKKKKKEKRAVKKLQKHMNKLINEESLPDASKEADPDDTTIIKNKKSNKIKKRKKKELNDCFNNIPAMIYSRNNSLDGVEQQGSKSCSPNAENKTPKKNNRFLFTYSLCK